MPIASASLIAWRQMPVAKGLQLWRDMLYGPLALNGVLIHELRGLRANPLNLIRIMPAEGLRAGFQAPSSFIR